VTTRRDFLKTTAAAGGTLLAGVRPGFAWAAPKKILVLGGTGYIGPYIVRLAASRGHQVTIFTRGRRDADLPDSIERLVGDRAITDTAPTGQLDALRSRTWDAVIDDSATDPRWVRNTATILKDSGRYLFVSSTGVFLPYLTNDLDEQKAVRVEPEGSAEYGIQKAQSEQVTLQTFGNRGLVVRPHFIIGPGDTSDRFPYWPQRLARGGPMLVPGRKTDPVQFVDVRDLTEFMIKLIEEDRSGIYNVAGPRPAMTMGRFVPEMQAALNSSAELTWIEDYAFLQQQKIGAAVPWIRLTGDSVYYTSIKIDKAIAAGLTFRPFAQTVRDTMAWWKTVPKERLAAPRFWITPEREAEVLAAWKARGESALLK